MLHTPVMKRLLGRVRRVFPFRPGALVLLAVALLVVLVISPDQGDFLLYPAGLVAIGLATANAGLITDIIACPGLDYCALANARSIPLSQEISTRFGDPARQAEIGDLKIKISGCINACGHHHVGHIGLLGVEKKGAELYQITLGGSGDENTSVGEIVGRGFDPDKVTDAVETIVDTYLGLRLEASETFLQAYRRVGAQPFKDALYGETAEAA